MELRVDIKLQKNWLEPFSFNTISLRKHHVDEVISVTFFAFKIGIRENVDLWKYDQTTKELTFYFDQPDYDIMLSVDFYSKRQARDKKISISIR